MVTWISVNAWWLVLASTSMMVGGLVLLFILAITMPADHFMHPHRKSSLEGRHPVIRILGRVLKNVVGAVMIAAGIVMAVPMVPGPGLLFILLGLALTDLPGKHALAQYIVSRPLVLRPLNSIRARWHRPPLQVPPGQ